MKIIFFILLLLSLYTCISNSQETVSKTTSNVTTPNTLEELFSTFKTVINNKNEVKLQSLFANSENLKYVSNFAKDVFEVKNQTYIDTLQFSSLEKVTPSDYYHSHLPKEIGTAYLLKIHSNNMKSAIPPTWFCYFIIIDEKPLILLRKIAECG